MKIFISHSGDRSRRVAELVYTWLENVVQALVPWVSSNDIDRGALWFTQIIDELATTTHGIICLTRENKEKPWILFEAGALAKGLASSRIYTLLVDLNPEDVRDPLAQFNHTRVVEGEMFKLISSVNKGLEGRGLKESVLVNAFRTYWPQFEKDFAQIIAETEATTAPEVPRPQEDVLSEILNAVRGIDKRVRLVETGQNLVRGVVDSGIDEHSPQMGTPYSRIPLKAFIRNRIKRGTPEEVILLRAAEQYPEFPKAIIPIRIAEVKRELNQNPEE